MTESFVVNLLREAFFTMLIVAGPTLALSLIVGLLISVFQAATSIQEFTLTFVPKLLVIATALILLMPWFIDVMVGFTTNLFGMIPTLAR